MAAFGKSRLSKVRGILGGKAEGEATPYEPARIGEMEQALLLLRDFEQSGMGWFWSTNAEGRIDYLSQCIAEQLGKTCAELSELPFHSLFTVEREGTDTSERSLPLLLNARKCFSGLVVRAAEGEQEAWWTISGRPRFSESGEFIGYRGNGSDITESRKSLRDTSHLAKYDSLTGLANRHSMEKRLETTLTAYIASKRSCALMMLDLDRFKQVNDTLGHPAGDDLLKQVAQRLQRIIPKNCKIGRLGGDEFQVILPDMDDRGNLGEIAKQIISMLSQPFMALGSRCTIGASVGVAIAPYDGVNSEELVRSADLALYAAKGGGRGQFRFYSSDLQSDAERRREIEEDLRHALANDQMSLVYKPVVDITKNQVVAFEAMLRWDHPEFGEVPRSVFVPVAEASHLMGGLGDWMLKKACEDAQYWPRSIRVAVNISSAQVSNTNFPALVAQALAASELPPDRLELEMSESIVAGEDRLTTEMLGALNILGVRLVIDHFGTGSSSFSVLSTAPVDKIKIDRTFLSRIAEEGNRNSAIIKAILTLARELNIETAADGIETREELTLMRKLGLEHVQGDIYLSAVSFDETLEGMANGDWIIEPNGPNLFREQRRSMLRTIGLIHEDYRYEVKMRNLSRSGCMLEGLIEVPVGTQFVVDFGEGQLAVGTVKRSVGAMQGVEFELPLVDDGAGGLVTRNRVSPYALASAGMPLSALPKGSYPLSALTKPDADAGQAGYPTAKFAQVDHSKRKLN